MQSWQDPINGFFRGLGAVAFAILDGVGRAVEATVNTVHAADVLARRYGWILSTSWPPTLVLEIGRLAEARRRNVEVDRRILSFYRDNDWCELDRLVEAVCECRSVRNERARVLRDLVLVMRAGDERGFNAASFAIPRLFAELEGIARDYAARDLRLVDTKQKMVSMKDILPSLRRVAFPIEKPALRLCLNVYFKHRRGKVAPAGKRRLHRPRVLHGIAYAPARRVDVLRVLLMIDLVACLIDRKRGVETERSVLRRAWAETLSGVARLGRTVRSLPAPMQPEVLPALSSSTPWRDVPQPRD
jgi:hypothetical protein